MPYSRHPYYHELLPPWLYSGIEVDWPWSSSQIWRTRFAHKPDPRFGFRFMNMAGPEPLLGSGSDILHEPEPEVWTRTLGILEMLSWMIFFFISKRKQCPLNLEAQTALARPGTTNHILACVASFSHLCPHLCSCPHLTCVIAPVCIWGI